MGCLLLAPSGTQPFTFHSCLGLPRAITTLVANQSRYPQHKNAEAPTPSSSSSSLSPSSLAYCTSVERKTTTESRKLAANKPKVQHRASATQHHVGRRQAVLERSLRAPSRRRLAQTLTGESSFPCPLFSFLPDRVAFALHRKPSHLRGKNK